MLSRVEVIGPPTEEELAQGVERAAARGLPLEVTGRGTKRDVGRPVQTGAVVTTEHLRGITLYEPSELVLSARAGTPLADIERTLGEHGQHLAFEPVELGNVLGGGVGKGTIGSVFAMNFGGSRRFVAGGPRDHLLGVSAVNGNGERIRSGGRVMKNVTGYDLCKALAGSFGTLAVMTEVTMKVLPRPEASRTIIFLGLPDNVAIEALCQASASPFELTGGVHLQASFVRGFADPDIKSAGKAVTALRIESFEDSARYRARRLQDKLLAYAPKLELDDERSRAFWREMQELAFVAGTHASVWRISVSPVRAAHLVKTITKTLPCRVVYDWCGGMVWLACEAIADAGALQIRRATAEHRGTATLIRAAPAVRAAIDVFQPLESTLADLNRRVKHAFDPAGILNPGRMYAGH